MAKRNRTERIELGYAICDRYVEGIYTIESVCKSYGIPYRTFMCWASPSYDKFIELDKKQQKRVLKQGYVAEVAASYKKAKDNFRNENRRRLKEHAKIGLLRLVEGYEYEEVTTEIKMDKKGNATPVRIKKIKKYMPPNVMAVIFALKNTDPEIFSETYKAEHSGEVGVRNKFENMTDKELADFINETKRKLDL